MAIANFFDKAAKAASYVIQGLEPTAFADQLMSQTVGIAFDSSACESDEGKALLEILVDLLSRLYPRIALRGHGAGTLKATERISAHARAINPSIELANAQAPLSICVGVGSSPIRERCPRIYAGSDGWLARFSPDRPVPCGITSNPFGAGAAACFAAANIFRSLFVKSLPNAGIDTEFVLSLFDLSRGEKASTPVLSSVDVGESHLVGLGAIGSAAVWALSRLPVTGTLHLIDHELIDLSNLQRYVLTTQSSVAQPKVAHAAARVARKGLVIHPHQQRWGEFVSETASFRFERVAVALDNVPDRILVQAALPRRILNAWTQPGDLGVSRHGFLGEDACLACLYLPTGKEPDLDEMVANSIGLPMERMQVRALLHSSAPVDRDLLRRIAQAKGVPLERLLPFEGRPLRAFYQKGVCGGMVLAGASGNGVRGAEVPMAFQSALAGILLAAELVADAGGLRKVAMPVATRINLLAPLGSYLTFPERKRPGNRCICQDRDYVAAYQGKYLAVQPA